jgi:general secretion pathway protein B
VVEVEAAPMAADPAPLLSTEPPPMPKQMSELPDGFVSNMPKLNIDIHSFDERPGRSYVLINMEKYREGEYLAEGPLLYEILQEGVILEYMGERFILPIGNY